MQRANSQHRIWYGKSSVPGDIPNSKHQISLKDPKDANSVNKFDLSGNTLYYVVVGNIVVKDAETDAYLFDVSANADAEILAPISLPNIQQEVVVYSTLDDNFIIAVSRSPNQVVTVVNTTTYIKQISTVNAINGYIKGNTTINGIEYFIDPVNPPETGMQIIAPILSEGGELSLQSEIATTLIIVEEQS